MRNMFVIKAISSNILLYQHLQNGIQEAFIDVIIWSAIKIIFLNLIVLKIFYF